MLESGEEELADSLVGLVQHFVAVGFIIVSSTWTSGQLVGQIHMRFVGTIRSSSDE